MSMFFIYCRLNRFFASCGKTGHQAGQDALSAATGTEPQAVFV
jgi:hypothetical protein